MLVHWVWLAHRPGITDPMKIQLLQRFQNPEELYYADPSILDTVEGLSSEAKIGLADRDLSSSEQILTVCREQKIGLLTIQDAAYPGRLKNIYDPPILLYYRGQLPDFDAMPLIAVVGTRRASAYGLTAAKRMGYQIGKCGGTVVSGMACGIDAMAMKGALSADAQVVGVLGCGVDVVYPAENRYLFADTEKFGCILSEFAPGTPPVGFHFPKRNRIISGLSCGVLVVEAPLKSGALITARQAAEQGRDVFVVPGNIDLPSFVGSNRLMRDGAMPVGTGWELMEEYQGRFPDKIHIDPVPSRMKGYRDEVPDSAGKNVAQVPLRPEKNPEEEKTSDKLVIDKEQSRSYIDLNKSLPTRSPQEAAIIERLLDGERLVDDLIAETGMTTGKMLALLTMLEIQGVVQRLPGKRVSLRQK